MDKELKELERKHRPLGENPFGFANRYKFVGQNNSNNMVKEPLKISVREEKLINVANYWLGNLKKDDNTTERLFGSEEICP